MLKNLHIENIAVIEKTDLTLCNGLNVLTGETGAGKSIVIDAINAVLGERTSRERIRTGCEKASVSALFCDLSQPVLEKLAEAGFSPDEEGNLLLQRTLRSDGKGTAFLNGQAVTAGILRQIGRFLINIHGQHDNQALLDAQTHLSFLDKLADNLLERQAYFETFQTVGRLRKELSSLQADEAEKARQVELLQYQVNELTAAQLEVGESERLKEKCAQFRNYEKLAKHLTMATQLLLGDEESDGAVARAEVASREMLSSGASALNANAEKLAGISLEMQSVAEDIEQFLRELSYSPEELEKCEQRLDFLHRLMLKYGNSEAEMLTFLADAQEKLQRIAFSEARAQELEVELEQAEEQLIALGERLSETRKKAAERLSQTVCRILQDLDMPQVTFLVQIEQGKYTKRGCDLAEFLISTNPGSLPKPLIKIASGGELSRIMLAIQSALADRDEVDTLIFDEIDTGISGRAAQKVGRQLARVSKVRQVICVTHLAQIAVMADRHLLIEKAIANQNTFTNVTALSEEGRVQEIARIMAGAQPSETVLRSARELLDRSKNHDLI